MSTDADCEPFMACHHYNTNKHRYCTLTFRESYCNHSVRLLPRLQIADSAIQHNILLHQNYRKTWETKNAGHSRR